MIIIQDSIASLIERAKNISRTYKLIIFAVLAVIMMTACMIFGGVRFSYDVLISGEKIAQISNMKVYEAAKEIAQSSIVCDTDKAELLQIPQFKLVLSVNGGRDTAEQLSTTLLEKSEEVTFGYAVCVDGEEKLYVLDKDATQTLVANRLNSFNIDSAECESRFTKSVTFDAVYADKEVFSGDEQIGEFVNGLEVVTTAKKVTKYTVPYSTVTTRTSTKAAGYMSVSTKGVNGVKQKSEITTYVNGVVTENTVVSDEVVSKPVNEVVVIGTGNSSYSSVIQNASSSGFIYPLEYKYIVTSPYGDTEGRSKPHKGIDLSNGRVGGAIYAAKSGNVTYAGFRNGYGYVIEINHGNGVITRYAHCNKLFITTGSYVSQGQVIAQVGNTGQSTGPHLHFEIEINGSCMDPETFLSFR